MFMRTSILNILTVLAGLCCESAIAQTSHDYQLSVPSQQEARVEDSTTRVNPTSAAEWSKRLQTIKSASEKRLTQMVSAMNVVNETKMKAIMKNFTESRMPFVMIVKSTATGESWTFHESDSEFLEQSLQKSLAGSGFAIASMALNGRQPSYFIVGDRAYDIALSTFNSFKCADTFESYLNLISAQRAEIQARIQHAFDFGSANVAELISEIKNSSLIDGDAPCLRN